MRFSLEAIDANRSRIGMMFSPASDTWVFRRLHQKHPQTTIPTNILWVFLHRKYIHEHLGRRANTKGNPLCLPRKVNTLGLAKKRGHRTLGVRSSFLVLRTYPYFFFIFVCMSSSLLYTSLRRGTARMLVGALLLGVFPHHMFATDTTSTSTTASTVNSGVVTLTATTLSGGADAVSGKTLSMSLVMTGANAIERSFMTFGPLAGGTNSGATFSIAMGGLGGGVDEVKASSTSNSFSGTTASAMGADLTLNVGNTNISLSLGRSGAAVASGVVDAVNANTSSPYVASLVNSDQVRLTAKTTGTGGNAPVIATDTNYTATNGAYVVTWATLSGGVDEVKAQTDSLDLSGVITQSGADITVNIGGSEIILPPGATPNQAALSVAQSINNTGANAYTATASGAKLHLTAKAAGSAGNSSLQYKDLSYNTAPGIAAWVITDSLTGTTSQSGSDLALNV